MSETATATPQSGKGERFINYLKELADDEDRAALAALRRSLGKTPGEAAEAHRHVLRFSPDPWDEWAYCLVAGLFAMHPESWPHKEADQQSTNFGASFARMKRRNEQETRTEDKGSERRFVALLDCHEDDLAEHLRPRGQPAPVERDTGELGATAPRFAELESRRPLRAASLGARLLGWQSNRPASRQRGAIVTYSAFRPVGTADFRQVIYGLLWIGGPFTSRSDG